MVRRLLLALAAAEAQRNRRSGGGAVLQAGRVCTRRSEISDQEIAERCLYPLAGETACILEQAAQPHGGIGVTNAAAGRPLFQTLRDDRFDFG